MKRVIKGQSYDTETATEVAYWDNGHFKSDFRWESEALYVTKRGSLFSHGIGGPLSVYGKQRGNRRHGGDKLWAVDEKKALEWCESHRINSDVLDGYLEMEEA